ncbi:transporter substrate-binding domain-containing protein [Chromobacterium vaccinii]|nr:transporter substrate-binding domain-containing protein [Chromobacterium vaccinii]
MRVALIALLCQLLALSARAEAPPPELLALTESLPPLSYEEGGEHKGFSNELLQMMLRDSGLRAVIEVKPWSRALREAQQTPNTLLYLTVRTPEREAWFKWIGPALPLPIEVFRLAGPHAPPASMDEIRRAKIAVARDTPGEKILEEKGLAASDNLVLTNDEAQSARLLYARRVQFSAGVGLFQRYAARQQGQNPEQLEPVLVLDDRTRFYFALQKDSKPEYAARLQAALDKIKQDGRYAALLKRYSHP